MWSYQNDDDIDDGGYVHDDDTHRFQIVIAIVNEALREVIQFQEPLIITMMRVTSAKSGQT